MQRRLLGLFLSLVLVLSPFCYGFAEEQSPDPPPSEAPVTTGNPDIPVDELDSLLKPLTKSQLLIEAEGWQAFVQAKAEQIAITEIAIKRQNQEIEKTEQIGETAESTSGKEIDTQEKEDQKVKLLEAIAELRKERTVLLDQFKAVVTALEAKTDENDADTLAKIRDYQLYASAVSGIQVDVKDATSTWLVIKTWLMSEEGGQRWGLNILTFIGILIATWIVSGIFSGLIRQGMKRVPGTSRLLEDFFVRAARWIVLAIGFIMALGALEVSVGPLLAVVGAAGFAIAFALQDSLSNFANGLMILFFRPFDVGHFVEAGGVSGKVESLNLVSTTIKTLDNRLMVVPNNKVWQDVITNSSAFDERRVDMEFGIGYNDDIDKAQAILEEVVAAHPKVLENPAPKICVNSLGESSVNFIVRPWAKRVHRLGVFWDITREVKKRFDAEGIGIPYPQRDVHLYLSDADRKDIIAHLTDDHPGTSAASKEARDDSAGS
jgi:small conductance mechanosensitive channel